MHDLRVERRMFPQNLSRDLVRQLCSIYKGGKVAVVAERPAALLAATRKQWLKIIRRLQRERSSTLNATKIASLTEEIAWMQALRFAAKLTDDILVADITFATAESFVQIPPICRAVYITYQFDKEKLHLLTSWMPKNSVVVIYE